MLAPASGLCAFSFKGYKTASIDHNDTTVTVRGERDHEVQEFSFSIISKSTITQAEFGEDELTGVTNVVIVLSDKTFRTFPQTVFNEVAPRSALSEAPVVIPVSNDADKFALACDGNTAVVVGANSSTPVSLVDLSAGREVATAAYPGKLARAVAIDDAGRSAIVVLDNPLNNTANEVRRVAIAAGALADAGESLAFGADFVSKVRIAPGGRFGIAIVGVGVSRIVAFSLPGLAIRGSVTLTNGTGNAIVFNHAGNRIYVRSGRRGIVPDVIEGFTFDPVSGAIGQVPTLRIDNVAGFTGVPFLEPMALSSDRTFLFVTEDTPTFRISRYDIATGGLIGFTPKFVSPRGVATPRPCTSTQEAVEYYHGAFDHYFVTTLATEIALLDAGTIAGWARTGDRFAVYGSGSPATAATCRFFSEKFAPKSSHFYTPVAAECATVKAGSTWLFEGEVFNMTLPAADGGCPTSEIALYRLYNAGQGGAPNHRYTTRLDVRAEMVSRGWTPEGNGIGVIGCLPGSVAAKDATPLR
jgi:hypothetical protein